MLHVHSIQHGKQHVPRRLVFLVCVSFCGLVGTSRAMANDVALESRMLYVGGRVGVDVATFGGVDADTSAVESNGKLGVTGAGMVGIDIARWSSIQVELAYQMKGSRLASGGMDAGKLDMAYVMVPIEGHIQAPISRGVEPYVSLGLVPNFLLAAQLESNTGNSADVRSDYSPWDLGIRVGAGATLALSTLGALDLVAQYEWGLFRTDATESKDDLKNRTLTFTIGFRYELAPIE
jgi:hypothetical protein